MAPTKSKARDEDEDVSQLRKPITLHGKPIEQILNSIHYGSPELRFLLMNECDIIFECKVCRALFRDLPNFIAHKRKYCSKSVADLYHFSVAELPEEKVVVVHPELVDDACEIGNTQTSSSCGSLEDTLQRIRSGEGGKSHAFKVQSDAADKLRRQRENARITTIRTRSIPTNSNAMFVDVSTTCVNFHERPSTSGSSDKSIPSAKTCTKKTSDKSRGGDGAQLRSKSSNKPKDGSNDIGNMLMKELKAIQIQNKVRQNASSHKAEKVCQEESHKTERGQQEQSFVNKVERVKKEQATKTIAFVNNSSPMKKGHAEEFTKKSTRENGLVHSSDLDEAGLVEVSYQDVKSSLAKKEKTLKVENEDILSEVSSSKATHGKELVSERSLRKNKNSLICADCGNIFSCKRSLRFHIKAHHSVKRTFYPCPLCPKVYYNLTTACRHLVINHNATKKEIKVLREDIKSKAFVKPIPMQESLKSAKMSLMSTRNDRRSRRKVNNAPFVYLSMKRGKRLPSKKDSVLNVNHVDEKEQHSNECKSSLKSSRSRQSDTEIKENFKSSTINENKTPSLAVKKHSTSIDTQMQRCPKCSRLFGRKSTFENHTKICGGISTSENKSIQNSHESVSPSTRRKGKESNAPSTNRLSLGKDEVDSCESETSSVAEINCNNSSFLNSSKDDMLKESPNPDKLHGSPHKYVSDSSDSSFNVSRQKSRTTSNIGNIFTAISNPDQPIFKMDIDDIIMPVVKGTANPNKGNLDSGTCDPLQSLMNKEVVVQSTAKGQCVKAEPEKEALRISNVLERPRRKRKVPSRNIGAVELLQKIHRVEKTEETPSGKRFRKIVEGNKEHNVVPRTRATANKVFVLNSTNLCSSKSKLQCYNHSRVNKFIDEKKMACLKCGAKFSFMHNLKRHIIRLHLKWSRFQCKLCNFSCFDKSECNTHIIRHHRNGQKPDRNHYFNTLIIDLAKKGAKAMAMKKHQTLIAKNQRQDDDKDIYRNKNAQKVPRLPERTSDSIKSSSSPVSEKQKNNQKKVERETPDEVKQDTKGSPSSTSIMTDMKSISGGVNNIQKISHLVAKTLRTVNQSTNTGVNIEKKSHSTKTSAEKIKHQSDDEGTSVEKMKECSKDISEMSSEKKKSELTKSGSLMEKTKLQSVSIETDVDKSKSGSAKAGSCFEKPKTLSRNVRIHVDKIKHQFAITGVEINENKLLSTGIKSSTTENIMKPPDSPLNPKLDKESTLIKSSHSASNLSTATSVIKKAPLPFNISTRNSPRIFDTTPYTRVEATAATSAKQTSSTKDEAKLSSETIREAASLITTFDDKSTSGESLNLKTKGEEVNVNGLEGDINKEVDMPESVDKSSKDNDSCVSDTVNSCAPNDCDKSCVKSTNLAVSETLEVTGNDNLCNSVEKTNIVIKQSLAELSTDAQL